MTPARYGSALPGPGRAALAALVVGGGVVLGACGGGKAPAASPTTTHGCAHPGDPHTANLVVEPSAGSVLRRCVGFSSSTIKAMALVKGSGVEVATQDYGSLGAALCQVDDTPAHYAKCLPAGKPYWAIFVSRSGAAWSSPPTGIGSITLHPGDSLGLRYDSPSGKPAPPSVAPPAR